MDGWKIEKIIESVRLNKVEEAGNKGGVREESDCVQAYGGGGGGGVVQAEEIGT